MRWRQAWLGLALVAGCASSLPSNKPLGAGPLAERRSPAEPAAGAGRTHRTTHPSAPARVETRLDASAPRDAAPARDAGAAETGPAEASASSVVFAGKYAGADKTSISLSGITMPPLTDQDAKLEVVLRSDGSLGFDMLDDSGKKVECSFVGHAKGSVVTFVAGQKCRQKRARTTLTSAKATVTGKQLVFDGAFELQVPSESLTGTMTYHFEGSRP